MKRRAIAIVLALVAMPLAAAPETVAEVMRDLSAHGYTSPHAAVARLEAARGAGDARAPLAERRRYYATLVWLALPDRNMRLLEDALGHLRQMAEREHCVPCRAAWLIGQAQAEILDFKLVPAQQYLVEAAPLVPADAPGLRLDLAAADVNLDVSRSALNVAFTKAMSALALAERLGDKAQHVQLLALLAQLDADLGSLDRAAKVAQEAADEAQSIGFTAGLGLVRVNQSYIYGLRDEGDLQLKVLRDALAISTQGTGLGYLQVVARANLSDYYLRGRDFKAALDEGQRAATLARDIGDLYAQSVAVANVGIAAVGLGRTDEGLEILRQSLALANQSGRVVTEAAINDAIVTALEGAGRYREALQAVRDGEAMERKITRQQRDTAVLALQAKYDDERKTREIERLSAHARLQDAQAAARRWQQRLWITLAAVALAAAVLLVVRLTRARRANRKLSEDVASLTAQSSLDALTGVMNRRAFTAHMHPNRRRGDAWVALVMVDIDHFKRVNDAFGHDFGDAVLVAVARRLQALGRRSHDHTARWGGEEFVLAMPEVTPVQLPCVARRLLDAVGAEPIRVGAREVRVTVSAGFAAHPVAPGSGWEQALRLADAAMYRAKRNGRNRAVCLTAVNHPRVGELADANLDAFIQSGAIAVAEVEGPDGPPEGAAAP